MPLSEPHTVTHFRREVAASSFVVFRQVALSPRHFEVANHLGADVLLKRRDDDASYLLCVGDGIRYVGQDRTYRRLFAAEPHRGWRVLAIIHSPEEEAVLRETDAVLGLDGHAPHLPRAEAEAPRQIVVRREELGPDKQPAAEGAEGRFGVNLVEEARAGRIARALHRDKEIDALIRILSKEGKNAACLVGEPGVGKTAVVEGLAHRVSGGDVPQTLARARILDVNLSFLAAGASYKNQFEGRVKELLDLARRDHDVILFLDEVHTIRASGSDASQLVKQDLGRGRIRCIGATTNAEYRNIEADAALARRFQVVPIRELTPLQTIAILRTNRARLEQHHGVAIPDNLLRSVVDLVCRYVADRRLPDKAMDLLDEACACARLADLQRSSRAEEQAPDTLQNPALEQRDAPGATAAP
jgi:ATP-dependent Clp protease ATP-binding subunit ClpA